MNQLNVQMQGILDITQSNGGWISTSEFLVRCWRLHHFPLRSLLSPFSFSPSKRKLLLLSACPPCAYSCRDALRRPSSSCEKSYAGHRSRQHRRSSCVASCHRIRISGPSSRACCCCRCQYGRACDPAERPHRWRRRRDHWCRRWEQKNRPCAL